MKRHFLANETTQKEDSIYITHSFNATYPLKSTPEKKRFFFILWFMH